MKSASAAASERLRASPTFALTFTLDGKPYIAKDTEPYIQYWLNERYRILLSMFSVRTGATVEEAIAGYVRLTRAGKDAAERKRLVRAINDMRDAGVLISTRDDTSRYSAKIVDAYVRHRPFPKEVSDFIIAKGGIRRDSRVLDMAGGPGDLALALAAASDNASMMDLSRGFVNAATRRARKRGLHLTGLHDSANRLVFRDEEYDVVTISQALHWLDDVMVCRGICRLLRPDGSFFVIHGAFEVADTHPLAYILGNNSVLGSKKREPFAAEMAPLHKRLTLLFDALDAPQVQRLDLAQSNANSAAQQIVPAGMTLFRQRRPMGEGYARAFLTPQHIAVTGQSPEVFWKDLEARCKAASDKDLMGTYYWGVMQFRRGGKRIEPNANAKARFVDIGFQEQLAG